MEKPWVLNRVLKGGECPRVGGVPGEPLRIPFGKIGVHLRED